MDNVIWREYVPSPEAVDFGRDLVLSACHYANRYGYDFSSQVMLHPAYVLLAHQTGTHIMYLQLDTESFLVVKETGKGLLLPAFLAQNFPAGTAVVSLSGSKHCCCLRLMSLLGYVVEDCNSTALARCAEQGSAR